MLAIELTNVCNFKCYFCSARNVTTPQIIDFKTFKSIIDSACELGITYIKLTPSNGEIFTDKDILKKLEYLENSKIQLFDFHTNFSLVTPKIQDVLKRFKKMQIFVSDYGIGNIDNFKYLTQMNDNAFYTFQKNIEYSKKIGLNLTISRRDIDYDFSFRKEDETLDEKYRILPDRDRYIDKSGVCSFLYIPRILSDGKFSFCTCAGDTNDISDEMVIGNIYNTPFNELYLNIKRLKMINEQKKNQYNSFCEKCEVFTNSKCTPSLSVLKNLVRIKNENS